MRKIHNKILRKLFNKSKPLLVAEISANHNGSLLKAKKLIECAKKNEFKTMQQMGHELLLSGILSYDEYSRQVQSGELSLEEYDKQENV